MNDETSEKNPTLHIETPIVKAFTYAPDTQEHKLLTVDDNIQEIEPHPSVHEPKPRQNIKRERVLNGKTYRSENPDSDYRIYVTINDNFDIESKKYKPFEIFISSKNAGLYQYMSAIALLITDTLKNNNDIKHIIRKLKQIQDTLDSGYLNRRGQYIPSVPAEIAYILEEHIDNTQFTNNKLQDKLKLLAKQNKNETSASIANNSNNLNHDISTRCPKCHSTTVIRQENCLTCTSCGYDKCGD